MATHAPTTTTSTETIITEPVARHSIELSWKSILAGVVSGLAIWMMLYTLGIAVGLTTIDPARAESMRATGIFSGVWTLAAPIIALFIGGAVAGRGAGPVTRGEGALHGLVTWGLTILIGAWLVSNVLTGAMVFATQFSGSFQGPGAMTGRADLPTQLEAIRAAGGAFWSLFGSIFLAMLAALAGAALGVSKWQRWEAKGEPISDRTSYHATQDEAHV